MLNPGFLETDCYRGPCFSYEHCVSEKCQVHAGCLVNTILQFWAGQYRAVAAWVVAEVGPAARATRRLLAAVEPTALPPGELAAAVPAAPPPGVVTGGCPPGHGWARTTIGIRCLPWDQIGFPATCAEVEAILGPGTCTGQEP